MILRNCLTCEKEIKVYPISIKRGHGKYCSYVCRNKDKKEAEASDWKGDAVGYRALHYWVVNHLGQPDTCEFCKQSGLSNHKIQWANKSHDYKRDLDDWIRLCVPCHREYDRRVAQ